MINVRTLKKLNNNDGLTLKNGNIIQYKSGWQVATEGLETTDVYEAMRSKRCYKEPIPKDEVIQHIKENAGTQFDPELAKLFVEMEDELF